MAYDPRFSAYYQVPFRPMFQSAQEQLERGIHLLEEKIKRKKDIEREVQLQIYAKMDRKAEIYQQDYSNAMRRLEARDRLVHAVSQNQIAMEGYRREYLAGEHRRRLQTMNDASEGVFRHYPIPAYNDDYLGRSSQGVNRNLFKDFNGFQQVMYDKKLRESLSHSAFAKQKQELSHQRQKQKKVEGRGNSSVSMKKGKELIHIEEAVDSTDQNEDAYKTYRRQETGEHNNSKILLTPYEMLVSQKKHAVKDENNASQDRSKHMQSLQNEIVRIEEVDESSKNQSVREENNIQKHVNAQPKNGQLHRQASFAQSYLQPIVKRHGSLNKFPSKPARINTSPNRSQSKRSISQPKSQKTRARTQHKELHRSALKKIQNRMKVSSITYSDSKFRNLKHEIVHLHNTYEKELKIRKEIKDKINGHPTILKNHQLIAN